MQIIITDYMEKSKSLHLIIDVHNMMEVCMHFRASLSHGLSKILENFAQWFSELLSFFPANNSQYAHACLSGSLALTGPSQALSLFVKQNWLIAWVLGLSTSFDKTWCLWEMLDNYPAFLRAAIAVIK